ncbi:MAG: OmpA family protein [Planctomycetota bacterium]|nr:OmpA family protein [Planctomycetota bacterium]
MKKVALAFVVILFLFAGCDRKDPDVALMAENEKIKVQIAQLHEQIETLRREMNNISAERNDWRDKYYASKVELEELKTALEQMKHRSAELQAKLEELKASKQELEDERSKLENKLANVEGVTVSKRGDEILLTLENRILFDSGKTDLKPGAKQAIDAIADALKTDFPNRMIRIEGHTDSDPISKAVYPSNWELSVARAANVLHGLRKKGVEEKRMSIAGFAYFRPVAPNDTAENKAKNRRVEIFILPPAAKATK